MSSGPAVSRAQRGRVSAACGGSLPAQRPCSESYVPAAVFWKTVLVESVFPVLAIFLSFLKQLFQAVFA